MKNFKVLYNIWTSSKILDKTTLLTWSMVYLKLTLKKD